MPGDTATGAGAAGIGAVLNLNGLRIGPRGAGSGLSLARRRVISDASAAPEASIGSLVDVRRGTGGRAGVIAAANHAASATALTEMIVVRLRLIARSRDGNTGLRLCYYSSCIPTRLIVLLISGSIRPRHFALSLSSQPDSPPAGFPGSRWQ
jgi:hypothetical protein